MNKQYKQYTEYLRRTQNIDNLKGKGFKFIVKKNKFKIVLGCVCLGVAIFPNGLGLVCYPLGFALLSINKVDLKQHKRKALRLIKYKMMCLR